MIVKVRKIGNSAGILLSKSIMEQCKIKEKVDIRVENDHIIIEPVKDNPREGWAEQFLLAGCEEDTEELMVFSNSFDDEEWTW